jgi:RHS repeat-associated protein
MKDVNRDGLADIVRQTFYAFGGRLQATEMVFLNQGRSDSGFTFNGVYRPAPDGGLPLTTATSAPSLGDLDGDGYYDAVSYFPLLGTSDPTDYQGGVGMADGTGSAFGSPTSDGYWSVLQALSPHEINNLEDTFLPPGDFGFALIDLNADGLADLVRNHVNRATGDFAGQGGGELLINTGTTWRRRTAGENQWQVSAGPFAVPLVPDSLNGSAFVDIDGDGVTDLVQEPLAQGSRGRAWLHRFVPPTITGFPNGMAADTTVAYSVITTVLARSGAQPTYSESNDVAYGTKLLSLPIRVVDSVTSDNGIGGFGTTTYQYADLRTSIFGYGPQGFKTMTVIEPPGDVTHRSMVTKTTFAQAFPYTGQPTNVERRTMNFITKADTGPVTSTATKYCIDRVDPAYCLQNPEYPTLYPKESSFAVHPIEVVDVSYLRTAVDVELSPAESITTTTDVTYDNAGNPTDTIVTMTGVGETASRETQNTYGDPGSLAQQMGKITDTKVIATKTNDPSIVHHTAFDYDPLPTLLPDGALKLVKTRVEPDSDPTLQLEVHTAFDYDRFGNVKVTTVCAADFGNCHAGALGPSWLPNRTTQVSYNPADFNSPVGGDLQSSLGYHEGMFPVKTINALQQIEYSAYDPRFGSILQTTDRNGIHTCYRYDPVGRPTTEIDRCGSDGSLTTSTTRYLASPDLNAYSSLGQTVTVTQPPTSNRVWDLYDSLGRKIVSLSYGFDGRLTEVGTEYDNLGRVMSASKPFFVGDVPFAGITEYDQLGRVSSSQQEVGRIDHLSESDGGQEDDATLMTTTYLGSRTQTTETRLAAPGSGTFVDRNRFETKNVLGKVATVEDAYGAIIQYQYDADGNLTDTFDPHQNHLHIGYDTRGRKTLTQDPDLGEWRYTYNGFGDLVGQTDPKQQAQQQTTTMTYDQLGRMRSKTDSSGTAQWIYDVAPGAGVGKLAALVSAPDSRLAASCAALYGSAADGNRATQSFTYTAFGQVEDVSQCTDGETFTASYGYDPLGRQSLVTYPVVNGRRLSVGYNYTSLGFLYYLSDPTDGSSYWAATSMNALGQVTGEITRNGVKTVSDRNPATGWLMGSSITAQADGNTLIQGLTYDYDVAGNVLSRTRADDVNPVSSTETFTYDLLDRLQTSQVATVFPSSQTAITNEGFDYDTLGNLTQKHGKNYHYDGSCPAGSRAAGPHAVCTIVEAGTQFAYDDNGNMVSGGGRTVTYSPANRPTGIVDGTTSVDFIYGGDGNRVVQKVMASGDQSARTLYVGLGGTGKSLYERTTRGNTTEHVHFLYAGGAHAGNAFALRVVTDNGPSAPEVATKYQHFDHLGSVTTISDERGHVVTPAWGGPDAGVLEYDAWGARRNPDRAQTGRFSPQLQAGHREFTGHETIPGVGLVNMNGRVYDPDLGRFLSPDPNIQFVASLQSYNRYSYVLNNPLRYNDPTGYFIDHDFDLAINISLFVTGAVMCAASGGAGCAVAFAVITTAYNATSAVASGAGLDQVLVSTYFGLLGGVAGGAIGGIASSGLGESLSGAIVNGAVSGAVSSAFSAGLSARNLGELGEDVLKGAARSAIQSAASFGLASLARVSMASADEASEDPRRMRGGSHTTPGGGKRALTVGAGDVEAKVVTADLARARVEVDRTINALNRWNPDDQANFQKWFGTTSPATRAAVLAGFQRMQVLFAGLSAANYDFDSGLGPGIFAATLPSNPALMDLGKSYFDDIGPLARAGSLIHEATHLNIIAATNAFTPEVYGSIGARALAAASPATALMNAENWNFFATQTK